MKKDYTLKLVLAMLVVVLVSLVSFVGVYKGRNLLKEYSLGKDFSKRKIATFSVVEEKTSEQDESGETENQVEESKEESESSEEQENLSEQSGEENANKAQPLSEEDKKKNYKTAKNNIAKRLTSMKSEEYDIRLDESTGKIVIEVPEDMDSTFISEVASKGKVEIKNTSSNEVIADGEVFKDASAALRDETFSVGMQQVTKKIVVLNMKLTKDGKKKIIEANPKYTDNDGNEADATFAIVLDGETLYSEDASAFIDIVEKNGGFELYMGQNDQGEELEKDYQTALAITAIIKCGEIPVDYQIDTMELISSSINIKLIIIVSIAIGILMLVFATYKFKLKGLLSVVSLIGLVATILLVLRYTNVKITLFTILGIAIVTLVNYIVILRTLNNKKMFNENFMKAMDILVPCIIVAIVFCCSPYTQLASFGMTIFWGLIVMCLYNFTIVRVFVEK
ncbi:MAG: hypothetical protein IJH12_03305 [Clostridia bacterium]|nr:hypothetical protein [Clostridia bacterium]